MGAGEKRRKKKRKGLGQYLKLKIASVVGSHNYKGVTQRGTWQGPECSQSMQVRRAGFQRQRPRAAKNKSPHSHPY